MNQASLYSISCILLFKPSFRRRVQTGEGRYIKRSLYHLYFVYLQIHPGRDTLPAFRACVRPPKYSCADHRRRHRHYTSHSPFCALILLHLTFMCFYLSPPSPLLPPTRNINICSKGCDYHGLVGSYWPCCCLVRGVVLRADEESTQIERPALHPSRVHVVCTGHYC